MNKTIKITILLLLIIIIAITFFKYAPKVDDKNITSATLTEISNINEDKKLSQIQTKEIIDFINSASKTRTLGTAKGFYYKIIIQRKNFNTEITLNGDQLQIGGSTYTSKDITNNFKKLLQKIGG